jgi:hypothetical protein
MAIPVDGAAGPTSNILKRLHISMQLKEIANPLSGARSVLKLLRGRQNRGIGLAPDGTRRADPESALAFNRSLE